MQTGRVSDCLHRGLGHCVHLWRMLSACLACSRSHQHLVVRCHGVVVGFLSACGLFIVSVGCVVLRLFSFCHVTRVAFVVLFVLSMYSGHVFWWCSAMMWFCKFRLLCFPLF